jgi:hypothetical protein
MKKSQKVLWMLIVLFFLASISFCVISAIPLFKKIAGYIDPTPTQNPHNAKLNNDLANLVSHYQQGQISVMDLATITPFEWDRVHLFANFPDFMDEKDIDDILGRSWHNIESCDYAVNTAVVYINSDSAYYRKSNGYSLFLFTHENTVVYCMFYVDTPVAHAYINSTDIKEGIPRENAFFIIDKQGIIRPIEK